MVLIIGTIEKVYLFTKVCDIVPGQSNLFFGIPWSSKIASCSLRKV
jgi:hypothetical protein